MMSDTSNPPQATPEATPGADAVDKLGALNMSARLRDMLSDHSTPKALPHAYADLRTRISDAQSAAVAAATAMHISVNDQLANMQKRVEDLTTTVAELRGDNEALRLQLAAVRESARSARIEETQSAPLPTPTVSLPVAGPSAPHLPTIPAGTNGGRLTTAPVPTPWQAPPEGASDSRNVSFAPSVVAETIPTTRGATPAVDRGPIQPPFIPPSTFPYPPYPLAPTAQASSRTGHSRPVPTASSLPFPDVEAYQPPSAALPSTLAIGQTVPGLAPMFTLLEPFQSVVDYRAYRLRNQREEPYQNELEGLESVVNRTKKLFPALENFSGGKPLRLLGLFHTLKKGFDALGIAEAMACRALHFFLTGEAERFYESQSTPGYLTSGMTRRFTWPHLVDAFLKRYLTDDVLTEAMEKVTRIAQKPGENESDYSNRLVNAAQECSNVFTERELVNHFISGLRPTTRSMISERLMTLPAQQRSDLTVVRRMALAEGNTYRARLKDVGAKPKRLALAVTETTPPPLRRQDAVEVPMQISTPSGASGYGPPTPTPHQGPSTLDWAAHATPEESYDVVKRLDTIFLMAKQPLASGSGDHDDEIRRILTKPREEAPVLTEEQRELAYSVIPSDAWQLSCWGCRDPGHSLFTCPSLTEDQRLFFAYKYYLYKVQESPSLAHFYKDRLRERREGKTGEQRPGTYGQHRSSDRGRGAFAPRGRGNDRRNYGSSRQDNRQQNQKRGSVFALPPETIQAMREQRVEEAGSMPAESETVDVPTGNVPDRS